MYAVLEVTKKGNATIRLEKRKDIELPFIERDGKNTEYRKFAVKDGRALVTVYAVPNKSFTVKLVETGTSANAHKFAPIEGKDLFVPRTIYISKQGKKIHAN